MTDWQDRATAYVYDAAGLPVTTTLPNGVTSIYAYDEAYRVALIQHATVTGTLAAYTYTVDATGNRTQVAEYLAQPGGGAASQTIDYNYDDLYRLLAADYDTGEYFHYAYDSVGNRLSQEITGTLFTTYTYDIANRLTSVGGTPYTWDDNGNLLDDGTSAYSYDAANRLTQVVQGADTYTYDYSGLGDRLRQTTNGVPISYTLDLNAGLTQLLADGENTYLYGTLRIGEEQPGGMTYHLPDGLGSVRHLADANGSVTLAEAFEPFGSVLVAAGTGSSVFGYTGEARDATDLLFLRARHYNQRDGRFIQKDKRPDATREPLTNNAWLYSYANPVNSIDPSGNRPLCSTGNATIDDSACDEPASRVSAPSSNRYNEKLPPPGISFIGNHLKAPVFLRPNITRAGMNQAQFIPGWGNNQNTGLCGEASLAAILGLSLQNVTDSFVNNIYTENNPNGRIYRWLMNDEGTAYINLAGEVVTNPKDFVPNPDPNYTSLAELGRLINLVHGANWQVDISRDTLSSWHGWPGVQWYLARNQGYPIAGILVNGSNGQLRYRDALANGQFEQSPLETRAPHWVVITGLSTQWNTASFTGRQWVRIYNPFDNDTEYYNRVDFERSFDSGSMIMVERTEPIAQLRKGCRVISGAGLGPAHE